MRQLLQLSGSFQDVPDMPKSVVKTARFGIGRNNFIKNAQGGGFFGAKRLDQPQPNWFKLFLILFLHNFSSNARPVPAQYAGPKRDWYCSTSKDHRRGDDGGLYRLPVK